VDNKPLLNIKSLKEQVYEYLRGQMRKGDLQPGAVIDMEETSKMLGVSKTPLRDALLQLEMEDFVTILPRRKVIVNSLTYPDIRNYYEIIGSLESTAVLLAFNHLKQEDFKNMERLINAMKKTIVDNDFDLYIEKNLLFHGTYLRVCGNVNLVKIVNLLKKRLFDFPRRKSFNKEWEKTFIHEHEEFLELLKQGKAKDAADYIRDVHWSYEGQRDYITSSYPNIS
jgi:DNA-binding GntR family transcriptional regulator